MTGIISGEGKNGKAGYIKSWYIFLPFFYVFIGLFLLFPVNKLKAQTSLPVIPLLDSRDIMFRQYMADVEEARRHIFAQRGSSREAIDLLTIYIYTIREGDDLLRIAARSNIPISSLASLNRLSNGDDLRTGMDLLLPSMPGIFIPERPGSDLEYLISSARIDENRGIHLTIPREGYSERFLFIPGDDFTPTERIYFLNRGFQFPLRDFVLTSNFGQRINPITGTQTMHRGIDLAAPMGTEVYAVRSGTVIDQGFDALLGNYIMIQHDNNWVSLYGHLSVVNVNLHSRVSAGSFIGRVGSTGQSTGPHLHFELIQNGQNQDPARLLRLFPGAASH